MPKYSRKRLVHHLSVALILRPVSDLRYAIGGATALAAYGYKRYTQDIDVFVLEPDLNALLFALRSASLEVCPVYEPVHYVAKLPGDPNFERRIDILVPHSEPELSAVEYAMTTKSPGWKVMTPNLLALVKFCAYLDSGDVRHAFDLTAMYRRGIMDAVAVRAALASFDEEALPAYDELVAKMAAVPRRAVRRRERRIDHKLL